MKPEPTTAPLTTLGPVLFCTILEPIPELYLEPGDRVVVEDLGSVGGVTLHRVLDHATARAILNLSRDSVSVAPVPRRAFDERRLSRTAYTGPHLLG